MTEPQMRDEMPALKALGLLVQITSLWTGQPSTPAAPVTGQAIFLACAVTPVTFHGVGLEG